MRGMIRGNPWLAANAPLLLFIRVAVAEVGERAAREAEDVRREKVNARAAADLVHPQLESGGERGTAGCSWGETERSKCRPR